MALPAWDLAASCSISNVRDIAAGMREATRYFIELSRLGAQISHVDVGGGLGIDYEGTRSRSYNSVNYGIHHYASSIVQPLAEACAAEGLVPPRIVTECGRAMTAHHAVLVTNVSEVEQAPEGRVPEPHDDESNPVRQLRELHGEMAQRPAVEVFHEATTTVASRSRSSASASRPSRPSTRRSRRSGSSSSRSPRAERDGVGGPSGPTQAPATSGLKALPQVAARGVRPSPRGLRRPGDPCFPETRFEPGKETWERSQRSISWCWRPTCWSSSSSA